MVVRMRSTRSHTGNRRSHHALKAPNLAVCTNCGAYYKPHHMCLACGFYKGRIVIDMQAKHAARSERLQAKRDMQRAQAAQAAAATAGAETHDAPPTDTETNSAESTEQK